MKRFNVYLPIELFERIKTLANFYHISISKAMVHLLEIGYLEFIKNKEVIKKWKQEFIQKEKLLH